MIGAMHRPNPMGGWNMFDFHGNELKIRIDKYILKFVNTSAGLKRIKRGTVNGRNISIKKNS
jgi:hypothetical protein